MVFPRAWREAVLQALRLPDHALRAVGLAAVLVGMLILQMSGR
jgi:uncharacterized protein YjeT (DUF2065 family)